MSIFKKRMATSATAVMVAVFALSACSNKNDETSSDSIENGVFSADACSKFNTPSEVDATNKVGNAVTGYDFNLFWLGKSSKIDFWTNKGMPNTHIMLSLSSPTIEEISRDVRVSVDGIADSVDTVKKTLNCEESKKSAKACKKHLEKMSLVIEGRLEQAEKSLEELSKDKYRLATLTCSKNFVDAKLQSLELIINPPVVEPVVDPTLDTSTKDIKPLPLPANKL